MNDNTGATNVAYAFGAIIAIGLVSFGCAALMGEPQGKHLANRAMRRQKERRA